ncbi:hypothetical protein [Frondihabitans cladoniiphilus]|uniref:Uncharacterized protein n=1 Tax=Frondihabitans cladoniiphilus TaxID=715785 RepID=A0ABP8VND9_9MICO
MTTDERALIRAAMQRLLEGIPLRSDGALTVVGLVAEAGSPVKRHHLTHKHTDLRDEFNARVRAKGFVPESETKLRAEKRDLEAKLEASENTRSDLQDQVEVLLRYNNALSIERDQLIKTIEGGLGGNITHIKRPRRT